MDIANNFLSQWINNLPFVTLIIFIIILVCITLYFGIELIIRLNYKKTDD